MENIATPRVAGEPALPTRLDLITRGGCASPAYLDVDRTIDRAASMLSSENRVPIAALRGIIARLTAHAEQLFRDHVSEVATTLPGGITLSLPTWSSDYQRLTYRLLLTYAQQAEERIAMLVRAVRS